MEHVATAMKTTVHSMVVMMAKMVAAEESLHGELMENTAAVMPEFRKTGSFGLIIGAIDDTLGEGWENRTPDASEGRNPARGRFIALVENLRARAKAEKEVHDGEDVSDPSDQVP